MVGGVGGVEGGVKGPISFWITSSGASSTGLDCDKVAEIQTIQASDEVRIIVVAWSQAKKERKEERNRCVCEGGGVRGRKVEGRMDHKKK